MQTPVKIDFHGTEPSESLERKIRAHVAALERFYGRLVACHVGVRSPGRRRRSGGLYQVDIHLVLPGGVEVVAGRTPRADERYANVLFAINDAFRRLRRQLQDAVRRLRQDVKVHEEAAIGKVLRFDARGGFGFIQAPDGHEVYFHRNSVVGSRLTRIVRGARVTFVEEAGERGLQASTVRLLGKHGMRHGASQAA
jgi:cold shock CspA family protein/ribosome-associated translation inhibitor RaiA